ncbi:hypothetical protein ACFP2T_13435 [Plantactinospora solaniradicis]|uniref:Uncharacterized protein n=1 Tax=Plantactinospora solaniradicis TaxID=1723736 RepID=A0ABW1K6P1_9ACTN
MTIDPAAVCMPCFRGDQATAGDTPHGCPGAVVIGDSAEVRTKLCECPICWPDGLPPMPPPPVFGGPEGSPLG